MIIGCVASSGTVSGGGGIPEWVPEDTFAAANLADEGYFIDGEIVARSDFLGNDVGNWPLDPTAFVEGVGFAAMTLNTNPGFEFVGDALSRIVDPAGVVVVLTYNAVVMGRARFVMVDGTDFNIQIMLQASGGDTLEQCNISTWDDDQSAVIPVPAAGVHKAAMRVTPAGMAASFDGAANITLGAPDLTPAPTAAYIEIFGAEDGDGPFFILTGIDLYDPAVKLDADLPSLSSIA
jgi:hypothetical protein